MTEPLAIIGMACRFPGAPNLDAYWELLKEGRNAVTQSAPGSGVGRTAGTFGERERASELARFGGFLTDVDQFDAAFFRMSPLEAQIVDPQQRLTLETTWRALEDAGLNPDRLRGTRAAVFTGVSNMEYREVVFRALDESPESVGRAARLYANLSTNLNGISGRLAFLLGLQGPAMAVDTACSSSLVATHEAAMALQHGEVDLALVAGVNLILDPRRSESYAEAGTLSPEGQCKAFDASADGWVRGEGCGVVVLKRLNEAIEDGDRIWGVVRGSGVNQSGVSAGPTAPSGLAQQHVIEQALSSAGVDPADVDYLEAHGTASELGDAIELEAAAAVYGRGRESERPLLVGSVKTNIGHTESASGMAGLIKTVLAMQRGTIPAHLHFEEPSQHLEWERLPVRVTDSATEWPQHSDREPLAAVSAFGITGANAHVVVEGYTSDAPEAGAWAPGAPQPVALPASDGEELPAPERASDSDTTRLLPLSARSHDALRDLAREYLEALNGGPSETLADIAWTAGVGRSHLQHRAGLVFKDVGALRDGLRALADSTDSPEPQAARRVGFVYDAEVGESPSAARALYEAEPVVRAILDRCDEVFRSERQTSLLDTLFGEDAAWRQPADYAMQCALSALWSSVGIRPDSVLGHGVGELAAAQAAGVLSLEAGLRLAIAREGLAQDGDPALAAFEAALGGSAPSRPSIVVVDGETGEPFGADVAFDAAHWLRRAQLPASSTDGSGVLGELGMDVVMNVGLEAGAEPSEAFVREVARAYEAGLDVAFAGLFAGELRRRVAIPAYPFQHRRYWLEPARRG